MEHKKLQDLMYIRYNQALKRRYYLRDTIDPIVLTSIDESNEWLMGEMDDAGDDLVFDDDDLTWRDVGSASGATTTDVMTYTRHQTRQRGASSSSRAITRFTTRPTTTLPEIEEDEDDIVEEEEEYNSDDGNEDDDDALMNIDDEDD